MKKQTYIRHLIGYTLIFFGFWKFSTHLIPNIIHHPQNYLYDVNTALFIFAFASFFIGTQVKTCINHYLWSNYPSQLTESDFDETDALEGEEV